MRRASGNVRGGYTAVLIVLIVVSGTAGVPTPTHFTTVLNSINSMFCFFSLFRSLLLVVLTRTSLFMFVFFSAAHRYNLFCSSAEEIQLCVAAFRLVSTTVPIVTRSSAACCVPAAFSVEFAETHSTVASAATNILTAKACPVTSLLLCADRRSRR